jgi:cobalt-zinc-cadmium efflux system membrane fusion protein
MISSANRLDSFDLSILKKKIKSINMSKFYISSVTMVVLFLRSSNISFLANIAIFPRVLIGLSNAKLLFILVLLVVFSSSALAVEISPRAIPSSKSITTKHTEDEYQVSHTHKQKEQEHAAVDVSSRHEDEAEKYSHQDGNEAQTVIGSVQSAKADSSQDRIKNSLKGNELQAVSHKKGVSFSAEKMAIAGIEVAEVSAKVFTNHVYAPGEIKANGYRSYIVSPRTESVVVSRHATLGQHVEKGDALVTLFSESVVEAQAKYRVAYNDWQRNKQLGKASVSESQLLAAETDYISAYSRLKAFGLTEHAIAYVVKNNSANNHLEELGEYTLIAQRAGAVLSDDFYQGQRVSAGDAIMVLADESELWVEARVSPNKQLNLPKGTQAVIEMAKQFFVATVIQEAHTIDPKTRTRIVRLAVKNDQDRLHPGMFVNVNFSFKTDKKVMAVAESALMRSSDGDWTVFVEDQPGEFTAVEITLGRSLGEFREIIGLAPDTRIVIQGAFFVASEIAKGGFDPHNH